MPKTENLKKDTQGVSASTANARNRVSRTAYNRLKSHSDKLDQFLESQGFKDLFASFKADNRKPVGNLYLYALNKAYGEFLQEEFCDRPHTIDRLSEKLKAVKLLFPEDNRALISEIRKSKS